MIELLISLLLGLLIGYNIGYFKGEKTTETRIIKSMPLIFKERSLIKGYCIICNQEKNNQSGKDKL